ncbi:MAG: hypothetical protein FWG69_00815 [Oscillospiraceae bacterium]|nr:hypothetical protein [Oscillospiraceae bacterium]
MPLTDEQASEVSGGIDSAVVSAWRKVAEGEGCPTHAGCNDVGAFYYTWYNAKCPKCNAPESLFCRTMIAGKLNNAVFNKQPENFECIDTKCYVCNYLFGTCELSTGDRQGYIQNWGRCQHKNSTHGAEVPKK